MRVRDTTAILPGSALVEFDHVVCCLAVISRQIIDALTCSYSSRAVEPGVSDVS